MKNKKLSFQKRYELLVNECLSRKTDVSRSNFYSSIDAKEQYWMIVFERQLTPKQKEADEKLDWYVKIWIWDSWAEKNQIVSEIIPTVEQTNHLMEPYYKVRKLHWIKYDRQHQRILVAPKNKYLMLSYSHTGEQLFDARIPAPMLTWVQLNKPCLYTADNDHAFLLYATASNSYLLINIDHGKEPKYIGYLDHDITSIKGNDLKITYTDLSEEDKYLVVKYTTVSGGSYSCIQVFYNTQHTSEWECYVNMVVKKRFSLLFPEIVDDKISVKILAGMTTYYPAGSGKESENILSRKSFDFPLLYDAISLK